MGGPRPELRAQALDHPGRAADQHVGDGKVGVRRRESLAGEKPLELARDDGDAEAVARALDRAKLVEEVGLGPRSTQ